MDAGPLQLTLRELLARFADPRALAVMAIVGVLMGLAGPFGTFEAIPVAGRVAYWLAVVFSTYGTGYSLALLIDYLWARGRPLWFRIGSQILAAGVGTSVVVTLLNLAVFGHLSVVTVLAQSFAVSAAVVAVSFLAGRPNVGPVISPLPPAILDRVPLPQRGSLLALTVEDHYVDIVTDKGQALVLMRLADAIRETAPVAGLQIHRSHWVASDAVVRSHRSDGKLVVELRNGMRLPVSRSYVSAVKEAGLI